MAESLIISLPISMPLGGRLSEANKQLSEWLATLDQPFIIWKDELKLTSCQRNGHEYSYHYIIHRDARISPDALTYPPKVYGIR
jgi:hypothetical protein